MKPLVIVVGLMVVFALGGIVEVQFAFPLIEQRVRAEGYRAGVQAQANDICIKVFNLPHGVLGADGFLIACDNAREEPIL